MTEEKKIRKSALLVLIKDLKSDRSDLIDQLDDINSDLDDAENENELCGIHVDEMDEEGSKTRQFEDTNA